MPCHHGREAINSKHRRQKPCLTRQPVIEVVYSIGAAWQTRHFVVSFIMGRNPLNGELEVVTIKQEPRVVGRTGLVGWNGAGKPRLAAASCLPSSIPPSAAGADGLWPRLGLAAGPAECSEAPDDQSGDGEVKQVEQNLVDHVTFSFWFRWPPNDDESVSKTSVGLWSTSPFRDRASKSPICMGLGFHK